MIVFLSKLPILLLLILSSTSVITGDYFAKYYSIHQKSWMLGVAILGYFLSGIFYIPTLFKESLVITSVIWSLISIIGFLFIGLVIFKETVSPLQTVGIILGVVALLILSYSFK